MKQTVCDRCGAVFVEYPWQATTFPEVSVYVTKPTGCHGVDLCRKCKNELLEWIGNRDSENNNAPGKSGKEGV